MFLDQARDFGHARDVPSDRFRVYLRQGIMQRLTVPESAAERHVKAIQKPQLEEVGTIEVVTEFAERERQRSLLMVRRRLKPSGNGFQWLPGKYVFAIRKLSKEV